MAMVTGSSRLGGNRQQPQQLPQDDQLLGVINSQQTYQFLKPFLAAAKITTYKRTGPFYAGLPRSANPLDSYDPDLCVLTYDLQYWKDYSRFVHACLTGQYKLGTISVPRFLSGKMLDQRSLDTFFAPFSGLSSVSSDATAAAATATAVTTAVTRWDRNSSQLFTLAERPIGVDESRLYFDPPERREQFMSLIPLYRDYGAEGRGTVVNRTGVRLNRNSIVIIRYILSFLESAIAYRDKLTDTARTVQTNNVLRETRQRLIERIARIKREKQADINDSLRSDRFNASQRAIIRRFNSMYRQTLEQIRAMTESPTTNRGGGRSRGSGGMRRLL